MEQEKQTNPTMPERFFGLPRTAINQHHKYEFKRITIGAKNGDIVDVLNEYGQEGWQPIYFSDDYELSGEPLPSEKECWGVDIILMRKIYN